MQDERAPVTSSPEDAAAEAETAYWRAHDRPLSDEQYADLRERYTEVASHLRMSVRDGRRRLELSQADLAHELKKVGLELDASAITRIESGQRALRAQEAWALAAVLRRGLVAFFVTDTSPITVQHQIGFLRRQIEAKRQELNLVQRELIDDEVALQRLLDEAGGRSL